MFHLPSQLLCHFAFVSVILAIVLSSNFCIAQKADAVNPEDLSKRLNNDYKIVTALSRSYSERLESAEKIIGLVAELRKEIGKAALELTRHENIQQKVTKALDQTDPLLTESKEAKAALVAADGRIVGILALLKSAKEEVGYLKDTDLNEDNHFDIFLLALARIIIIIDAYRLETNYTSSENWLANDEHLKAICEICANVKKSLKEINVLVEQSHAYVGDAINKAIAKTSEVYDTAKSILAADNKMNLPKTPSLILREYEDEKSAIMLPKSEKDWKQAAESLERAWRAAGAARAKLAAAIDDCVNEVTTLITVDTGRSRWSGTVKTKVKTKEQVEAERRARANDEAAQYEFKQAQAHELLKRQEFDIEKILANPTSTNAILASLKIKEVLQPVVGKMPKNSLEYKAVASLLQKMDRILTEYAKNDAEARKLLKTVKKAKSTDTNKKEANGRQRF